MNSPHRRRSIRLQGYDYSRTGAYFITICTQGRVCLFGNIVDGEMVLNDAGKMIERWWLELNNKYPAIETDEFVVMPNHFHGIAMITTVGADLCVRPEPENRGPMETGEPGIGVANPGQGVMNPGQGAADPGQDTMKPEEGAHAGAPLHGVLQWFKTMSTNEYIRGVKQRGWMPFPGKLWQRNYYEHIVRNESELNRIRQYIIDNPANWANDSENPSCASTATVGAVREPPLKGFLGEGGGMSDWTTKPLETVAEIRPSNVDKKSNPGEQAVRLCNYMDVYSREYITEDIEFMEATATSAEIQRFGIERGDVMITKDSETPDDIGIPAVVVDEIANLVCGYHVALIKPHQDEIEPIYLAKQLAHADTARYFGRLANGSTRYGLSYRSIANTPIRLAPLPQQQRIAEILSTVDEAIEQTEALIAKTQTIKAGLMHDLFTRGVTPNGQLRPPREEAPQLYKQSPLGWIPKEWEVETLAEVGNWMSGGTPSKAQPAFWGGSIPWVTPKDMKVFVLRSTQDRLTKRGAATGSRVAPQGSVFIVVRGMILAHTFPVCLAICPMAFNQDVKAIVPRVGVRDAFLAYWFVANRDSILGLVTEATHGTKRIDLRDLHRSYIAVAMDDEQDKIIDILQGLDVRIERDTANVAKLRQQKSGLMHDLLTGRVSVTPLLKNKGRSS